MRLASRVRTNSGGKNLNEMTVYSSSGDVLSKHKFHLKL